MALLVAPCCNESGQVVDHLKAAQALQRFCHHKNVQTVANPMVAQTTKKHNTIRPSTLRPLGGFSGGLRNKRSLIMYARDNISKKVLMFTFED